MGSALVRRNVVPSITVVAQCFVAVASNLPGRFVLAVPYEMTPE